MTNREAMTKGYIDFQDDEYNVPTDIELREFYLRGWYEAEAEYYWRNGE